MGGTRASHGLATASDAKILDFARQGSWIVVTLDADFHALLALSGATGPSVVRVRIEGQRAEEFLLLIRGSRPTARSEQDND
jgi:predicted nuclease of predicted toxin-antitoxin system